LNRILVHLKPLERNGLIDLWSDKKIKVGDKWKERITEALLSASVAILLISADFLASDFIVDNELPPILSAAENKGTRIIPLVIKPSRFIRDSNLSKFQALNDPSLPLIRMSEADREETYQKLSELIEVYKL